MISPSYHDLNKNYFLSYDLFLIIIVINILSLTTYSTKIIIFIFKFIQKRVFIVFKNIINKMILIIKYIFSEMEIKKRWHTRKMAPGNTSLTKNIMNKSESVQRPSSSLALKGSMEYASSDSTLLSGLLLI